MMMSHSYIPLLPVERGAFRRMVTHLDPSIRPTIRSKLTRTLIPQKLKKSETDASSFLDCVPCVLIYYDLWLSKMTQESFQ